MQSYLLPIISITLAISFIMNFFLQNVFNNVLLGYYSDYLWHRVRSQVSILDDLSNDNNMKFPLLELL